MSAPLRLAVIDGGLAVSHAPDGTAAALMQASAAVVDIARALGVPFDGRSIDDVGAACVAAAQGLKATTTELRKSQLVLDTMTRWRLR